MKIKNDSAYVYYNCTTSTVLEKRDERSYTYCEFRRLLVVLTGTTENIGGRSTTKERLRLKAYTYS